MLSFIKRLGRSLKSFFNLTGTVNTRYGFNIDHEKERPNTALYGPMWMAENTAAARNREAEIANGRG